MNSGTARGGDIGAVVDEDLAAMRARDLNYFLGQQKELARRQVRLTKLDQVYTAGNGAFQEPDEAGGPGIIRGRAQVAPVGYQVDQRPPGFLVRHRATPSGMFGRFS